MKGGLWKGLKKLRRLIGLKLSSEFSFRSSNIFEESLWAVSDSMRKQNELYCVAFRTSYFLP